MALSEADNPAPAFPAHILETTGDNRVWWVAHTKSRREKALAHFMAGRGIGYYLPLIKKRQPGRGRTRYSLMPLFSGYLFFSGTPEERYRAYTSNHIARVIAIQNQAGLLDELRSIQHVLASGAPVYPYDFLSVGQRVRISSGPMRGCEGIIDRKKGRCRLVLQVQTIAQAIALDLEADMVEAA